MRKDSRHAGVAMTIASARHATTVQRIVETLFLLMLIGRIQVDLPHCLPFDRQSFGSPIYHPAFYMEKVRETLVLKVSIRDRGEPARRADECDLLAAFGKDAMVVVQILNRNAYRALRMRIGIDARRADVYQYIVVRIRLELVVEFFRVYLAHRRRNDGDVPNRREHDDRGGCDDDRKKHYCRGDVVLHA